MDNTLNTLDQLPASRRKILLLLKHRGRATTMELARAMKFSHEAIRRQLIDLSTAGFIKPDCEESGDDGKVPGRPPVTYCLTPAGDHFFPKRYDELALLFMDASAAGARDETEILDRVTKQRLSRLGSVTAGRLQDSVRALQNVYAERDPFIQTRRDGADYVIVEKNCPYLNVALERPAICSTTVSLMRYALGMEVVREERFQDDDGRCTFRALADRPVSERRRRRFEFEPPKDTGRGMTR